MLVGKTPFEAPSIPELLSKIVGADIEMPAKMSPEGTVILHSLLQRNPNERLSFQDFFCSEYLDLEHYPSPDSLQKGVATIQEATRLDEQQQYADALFLYQEGIGFLLAAMQCNETTSPTYLLLQQPHGNIVAE